MAASVGNASFHAGYQFDATVNLTQDGSPLNVAGETISAMFVEKRTSNKSQVNGYHDAVSVSEAAPGADWANGVLAVTVTAADTAKITSGAVEGSATNQGREVELMIVISSLNKVLFVTETFDVGGTIDLTPETP